MGCLDRPGRSRATRDRVAELNVVCFGSLPELLASSDLVSLHLPSSAETTNLVDADFLPAMKCTGERIDVEVVGVGLLHHEVRGGEQKDEHRHGDGECLDRTDG